MQFLKILCARIRICCVISCYAKLIYHGFFGKDGALHVYKGGCGRVKKPASSYNLLHARSISLRRCGAPPHTIKKCTLKPHVRQQFINGVLIKAFAPFRAIP